MKKKKKKKPDSRPQSAPIRNALKMCIRFIEIATCSRKKDLIAFYFNIQHDRFGD